MDSTKSSEKRNFRSRHSALALAALAAIAAGFVWAAPVRADEPAASEPTNQELIQKLQAMKARLQEMDAKDQQLESKLAQTQAQTAQVQRQRVDADIESIRKDAAAHSQLLDLQGFTAGYNNGKFIIQSGDGSFLWHPWIHFQFREVLNHRQNSPGTPDDTENGFEVHRLRFGFDGSLFSPDFTYFFNWADYQSNNSSTIKAGTSTGAATNVIGGLPYLQEAWVKYKLPNTDFYLKGGQLRDPLAHEEIIGSKTEIALDRSLANDIFSNTEGITEAVSVIYDPHKNIRAEVALNHGLRGADTNFQDYPNNGNAYDWGMAGRVEYKVMGDWKEYDQMTAYGNKSDLLVFGAGCDYSEGGRDAQFVHAFDAQYGGANGLFLYGSYIGRYTRHNLGIPSIGPVSGSLGTPGVSGESTYEPSIEFQANYAIDRHWEPFARYEYMHLAGTPAGSDNNVQEITGGVGYWFHGHNAKLSTQIMYLPNGIPIADSFSDVLLSNHHQELIWSTQFQLLL